MRRRRFLWCALALSAALGSSACGAVTDGAKGQEFTFVSPGGQVRLFYDPPQARRKIAEIAGEDLLQPGGRLALSQFQGEVVVLNIWGSWCGPCRREMPDLQALYDQNKAAGVQLLGIDVRDGMRSAPVDFVRNLNITYPSIYDPAGRTLLALKGYPRSVVPSTIVLDRSHRVAAIYLTQVSESELQPLVERLAGESEAELR